MSNISFTIGHPRLIHEELIAVLVDLQSIVVYDTEGNTIAWIHESAKQINFATGHARDLHMLQYSSELRERIKDYTISFFEVNGNTEMRQWGVKTQFIYPPLPASHV